MPIRPVEGRMTHNLKCWPEYFEAILQGDKTFEVRFDDRGYRVGDTLIIKEWRIIPPQ